MIFLLCHHRVISPLVTAYIAPFAVSPQSFVQLCSELDLEMDGIRSIRVGKNWNQRGGASSETTARFRGQSSEEPSIVSGGKVIPGHFTMWKGAGISMVWNGLLERCLWRSPEMILWSALLCRYKYVCSQHYVGSCILWKPSCLQITSSAWCQTSVTLPSKPLWLVFELCRQCERSGCQMCTQDPSHANLRRLFQPSIIKTFKNKLWLWAALQG